MCNGVGERGGMRFGKAVDGEVGKKMGRINVAVTFFGADRSSFAAV
jgi:hypothetical protein